MVNAMLIFTMILLFFNLVNLLFEIKEKIQTHFILRKNKGKWVIAIIDRDTKIIEKKQSGHINEYKENKYKGLKYIHKMESYGLGSHSTWYDSKLKGALMFETAQMALDYVIKYKGASHEVVIYQLL